MGLFKRRQKQTADIRFLDHNGEPRKSSQWTSEETIEGIAAFQTPPGTDCTHVCVALKGTATVRTNESPVSLQPSWRTAKVKFLSVGKEFPSESLLRSGNVSIHAPFDFDLKDCLASSEQIDSGLPPSVDSKIDGGDRKAFQKQHSKVEYDVTYSVTASAISNRAVIASESRNISLLPTEQPDLPPYGSGEGSGEYFTAEAESTRTKLPFSKRGDQSVDVAAQEPAPLVFQIQNCPMEPSTSVNMVLKVSSEETRALSNLPQQAQVRSQLIQKTHLSPDGSKPTARRLSGGDASDTETRSHVSNIHDCTLAIPHWETIRPGAGAPDFAIANFSLLYRHTGAKRPGPPFSTPILSREHALEVSVSFPGDSWQGSKLSLPIQIMYTSSADKAGVGSMLERKTTAESTINEIPK